LSATLGDMEMAVEFLRPAAGPAVIQIVSMDGGGEPRLQLRGYEDPDRPASKRSEDDERSAFHRITGHLFKALRGRRNLLFINSKSAVELYADALRRLADQERVPNEFFPHHGSLSKALREDMETMLKDGDRQSGKIFFLA